MAPGDSDREDDGTAGERSLPRARGDDGPQSDLDETATAKLTTTPLPSATRDRQILVVGAGVAGLALAAFLARAGYDPILLADPDRGHRSRVACLDPLGRTLLGWTGVSIEAFERENRMESVSVRGVDTSGRGSEWLNRDHGPLVVAATTLRDHLWRQVPDDAVRSYRVTDVTPDRGALAVRFDNGVREWFDLVVGTDDPVSSVRRARGDTGRWPLFDQFEVVIESETGGEHWDHWTADGLAQTRPLPSRDGTVFRFTTASEPAGEDQTPADRFHEATTDIESSQFTRLRIVDPETVVHTSVAQAGSDGGNWGDGRIAYCGGAAFPVAPATGLRTTLALADAWVLVDELLRGPASVTDAVDSYGQRRRHRIGSLLDEVDPPAGTDANGTALPTLAQLRVLADRRYRGDEYHQPTPEHL